MMDQVFVIVSIAALSYFGIASPKNKLPERCVFPVGLTCVGKPSVDAASGDVQQAFKNTLGFPIEISSIQVDEGCTMLSWDAGSGPGTAKRLENDEQFIMSFRCAQIDSERPKFDVTISYRNLDTTIVTNHKGTLEATAQNI